MSWQISHWKGPSAGKASSSSDSMSSRSESVLALFLGAGPAFALLAPDLGLEGDLNFN